ncbi:MAG: ABC transporter substrate-binding protein, partial [Chloroflexota bacterium]
NTMTAGTGFPDIFYYDVERPEFIEANWVADLSGAINWDNVEGFAKDFWTRGSAVYALGLEASTNEIYYNVARFEELGIEVPEDKQFTAAEFLDVCKTCREAGYDPLGQPGNYWAGAQRFYKYILLHQLGSDKLEQYWLGDIPADDPDVLKAVAYVQEIMAVPALPTTFSTMTLAEGHTYFHTQQKSCMFVVGSWYTGRAFVPPEDGGQPADFRLSFLKYPEMPGGAGNNEHFSSVGGSLAVAEKSPNKDIALDIVNFFAQEKYGNLWMANTGVQTGIKTNPATMPETPYPWYFEEYAKTHAGLDMYIHNLGLQSPEMKQAWLQVFNEGLPLSLITWDEAVQILEEARAAAGKK